MQKFNIIYADPAWEMGYVKGGKYAGTVKGGVDLPYPTMSDAEIMALKVKDIAADDAVLFMWVPDCKIPIMVDVMKSWGFRYVTNGFVWHKVSKYDNSVSRCTLSDKTRRSCEYCYIGVKGKPQKFIQAQAKLGIKKPEQFIAWASETRKHSVKPPEVRDRIVQLYGDLPRIELFARQKVNGWEHWGNEISTNIII